MYMYMYMYMLVRTSDTVRMCVRLICTPYMYALYVCLCGPQTQCACVYALYVRLICACIYVYVYVHVYACADLRHSAHKVLGGTDKFEVDY